MDTATLQKTLFEIKAYKPEVPVLALYRTPILRLINNPVDKECKSALDASVLEAKLKEFGFEGSVVGVHMGPMITRYEVKLAPGVRLSQVRSLSEDLAIALMSEKIRIQAPIPGTSLVGIEVANVAASTVGFRKVLKAVRAFDGELPIGIGVDIVGNPKVVDLAKMPHLLIAGQTGSGKSVGLNTLILSILFTKSPEDCKLVLVDPKRVEMTSYEGLPHLLRPVVTEPEDAVQIFEFLVNEMDHRYRLLSEAKVRNIVSYNESGHGHLPYIVTVIDEMADLMMTSSKQVEAHVVRLAQLARAVGIHLVMATQKPLVKVITGLIKSNMPSRISYQVTSKNDSRVILDCNGAEKLIGRGDLLMTCPGIAEPDRFHGAWVSDSEIERVCSYIKGV